jgi:hypothetical protein
MEGNDHQHYFSKDSLQRFIAAEGQAVEKVICHLWLNLSQKEETMELIDNVELHFNGGNKLTIGCNPQSSGLEADDFNLDETLVALKQEFGDKIKVFAIDASTTSIWKDIIGSTLEKIRLTKEADNYKSDAIVLDFGDEKREIAISPMDGLIIDYFEE